MSDSNNPTLQPPAAPETVRDLKQVISEAAAEVISRLVLPRLDAIDSRLDRMEREHRDFRQEMRRSISEMNRTWLEQSALHTRMSDNRLADVEHRLDTLEAKPA